MSKGNLKKKDIVKNLRDITGFSYNLSKTLIDDLIYIIIENIKNDNFYLKNVGSFKLIKKKERFGRNPKTKKEYLISSRKTLKFIVSSNIKDKLNLTT